MRMRPCALVLACWLIFTMTSIFVGCGGGTPSTQAPAPNPVNGISACVDGTVASFMGTACSQSPAVMQWTSYSCTSVPSTICTALGTNGSNIKMKMDPNGNHTILVVGQGLWNVAAGQSVDVVIHGTVYGAKANNNWPHFGTQLGQTG